MKATRVCTVDGCDRPRVNALWCNMHRLRMAKRGTLELAPKPTLAQILAERSRATPSGCVVWTGGVGTHGYGKLRYAGRNLLVHRVAWELANGQQIEPGMQVCHSCDNPPCINPAHLFLGTVLDNARDRVAKGRSRGWDITHCPRGHEYAGYNLIIGRKGERKCRECGRIRDRERARKRKAERGEV